MILSELTLRDLRCIEQAELSLHPGLNLIWGGNGSGKTSLLEGMFLLGRGRSFRTRNSERLVRHGQERLVVFGRTEGSGLEGNGLVHALGVEVHRREGTRARIDAAAVGSLADLSRVFPVQVIDPEIHKLIEEGGRRRRRWLDWAVFHVEPQFADWWVRYGRAIRQRNAALRERGGTTKPWDVGGGWRWGRGFPRPVARLWIGCSLTGGRFWMGSIVPRVSCTTSGGGERSNRWRKRSRLHGDGTSCGGSRMPGPHRADVLIRVDGRLAREVLSRGQQKLMAVALTLAQLRLLKEVCGDDADPASG